MLQLQASCLAYRLLLHYLSAYSFIDAVLLLMKCMNSELTCCRRWDSAPEGLVSQQHIPRSDLTHLVHVFCPWWHLMKNQYACLTAMSACSEALQMTVSASVTRVLNLCL